MTKTLEELKKIAEQHLTLQLEMMKGLPYLNIRNLAEFQTWYTFHPLQTDITEMARKLAKIKFEDLPIGFCDNV